MKPPTEVKHKTKEAAFLAEIIGIFREEVKNPLFATLALSLNSLVKAVDASESMQKIFTRIFNHVKENWDEDRSSEL